MLLVHVKYEQFNAAFAEHKMLVLAFANKKYSGKGPFLPKQTKVQVYSSHLFLKFELTWGFSWVHGG